MAVGSTPETPEEEHHVRRLVSSLRTDGGVGVLSAACHAEVPEADGVFLSVLAVGGGYIMLSDSGRLGDHLEDLHTSLAQGPMVDASMVNGVVTVDDLGAPAARGRWPRFAPQASAAGVGAFFAYPVSVGPSAGVLSLYRYATGPLSPDGQAWAGRYSRAAAVLLHANTTGPGRGDLVLPVYTGEVQQAVGIVMELAGVDAVTALHRIRTYAHHSSRPMREVVAEVRTCRLPFDPTASA